MGQINFTKMKVLSVDKNTILISTNFKRGKIHYSLDNDGGYMLISTTDNMDIYDVAKFVYKLFHPTSNFIEKLPFLKKLISVEFNFNECTISASKETRVWAIVRRYETAYKKKYGIGE